MHYSCIQISFSLPFSLSISFVRSFCFVLTLFCLCRSFVLECEWMMIWFAECQSPRLKSLKCSDRSSPLLSLLSHLFYAFQFGCRIQQVTKKNRYTVRQDGRMLLLLWKMWFYICLKKTNLESVLRHTYKLIQDFKRLKSKNVQYHDEREIFGPYDDYSSTINFFVEKSCCLRWYTSHQGKKMRSWAILVQRHSK